MASQQSSPHKASQQGHDHFSAAQLDAKERRKKFITEMTGQFVGPMPIEKFIDTFLQNRPHGPKPELDCKAVPKGPGKERAMYAPLVSAPTHMFDRPSLRHE